MNITRKKLEALVWRHKHRDFKGTNAEGERTIMVLRPAGSCLVPLAELGDNDLIAQLPERVRDDEHRLFRETTIERLRAIVRDHQYQEVDGHLVDAQTAHAVLSVHDKLSEKNRERFAALPIAEMVEMTWRLVG